MRIIMLGRYGAYPAAGGATSGFLLQTNSTTVLVDCGSGVLGKLQLHTPVETLSAVILSHYHQDHMADLGVLQYAALVDQVRGARTEPLPQYLPEQPREQHERALFTPWCETTAIRAGMTLPIGDLTVQFVSTKHTVPCLGMTFSHAGKKICYTADTAYHDDLALWARGADVLICETSFLAHEDTQETGHLTTADAALLATKAEIPTLIMTHLPPWEDATRMQQEVRERYPGVVLVSEAGLTVDV